ncbi:hypothetical protein ATANTOWER_007894 [Ataeniobius toweri]|uniref:Uncharacterized protein n=1 Tax=Ataeniobius toweri TaxID=208326 RepID=A0ABU7AMW0_9TELE|nr:hypothetical protein [Ataeniobius toweri]
MVAMTTITEVTHHQSDAMYSGGWSPVSPLVLASHSSFGVIRVLDLDLEPLELWIPESAPGLPMFSTVGLTSHGHQFIISGPAQENHVDWDHCSGSSVSLIMMLPARCGGEAPPSIL